MVKEAEENKEKDEKRKEEADLRNDAEQLVFQTKKSLKDLGDKVSDKEKEEAEDLIKDLEKALEDDDLDEIKEKKDALQEKAMALATKVYEQVSKEQEAEENSKDDDDDEEKEEKPKKKEKKDDDVEEAEYEEK